MKYFLTQSFILTLLSSVVVSEVHRVKIYRVDQEEIESNVHLDTQSTIERFNSIEPVDDILDDKVWLSFKDDIVSRIGDGDIPPRRSPRIDAERVPIRRGPAGISFVGRVGFGTPPQYFRLSFDIGSGDTWVVMAGANCSKPDICSTNRHYFNPNKSSTFESWPNADWKAEFSDSFQLSGKLNTDIVQVGGYVIDRQVIGVADVSIGHKDDGVDGVLGLGLRGISSHGDANPIENLIEVKGMKSEVGIWLGSGRLGGELVFGDSDPERFKGSISRFNLPEYASLWSVPVLSIATVQSYHTPPAPQSIIHLTFNASDNDNNEGNNTENATVEKPAEDPLNRIKALAVSERQPNIIFDTSSNLILLPPSVALDIHRRMHNFLFGFYSGYSILSGAYTVSCDLDVDVWVELGPSIISTAGSPSVTASNTSTWFKISAKDIVGERLSGINSLLNTCISKIQGTKSDDDDWLFGYPWFVNNYMTLDHKNRQVGIAPSVRPEESNFQKQ